MVQSQFECIRDGLTIRGTEYRPEGENLPIAVVSHGFMAFQDTVRQYAEVLAEAGYASYIFDFCGGCVVKGKSDGATTEMSVLTEVKDTHEEIKPYPGEVLIVHGTKDDIVKMEYSQKAYEAYVNSKPERKIVLRWIDGGKHGFSAKHDKIAIEEIKKFIDKK